MDLFGSRATGRARPSSDVDLVIRGDVDEALLDRLRTLLAEAPIALTVDVVADGLIDSPGLAAHIERVRRTLFTRADLAGVGEGERGAVAASGDPLTLSLSPVPVGRGRC